MIHGLLEVDVTTPRRLLKEMRKKTGEGISFTGFIIYCFAQAVDGNKKMHAYRDLIRRLVIFEDVDVSVPMERIVDGRAEVVSTIVRAANKKSVQRIHRDIREAQSENLPRAGVYQILLRYLKIPRLIRRIFTRILGRAPHLMKSYVGTVMVTSLGMFGRGASWGIPVATHTLNVAIGGIDSKVMMVDGRFENRERLCLTVSFDHDLIDGAPAARFIHRFRKLIEEGCGLTEGRI
jgi:pyruvate/2-oxoglutarate dehydrogenase complex dihydrolipoamide acyltransferase (E2) component